MKKIFLSMFVVIVIPFMFPLFARASYTAPNGNTYEYKTTITVDSTYDLYSNYPFCFADEGISSGWYYLLTIFEDNNEKYLVRISATSNSYNAGVTVVYPSGTVNNIGKICVSRSNGSKPDSNISLSNSKSNLLGLGLDEYSTYEEAYNALTGGVIDFENIYYSPQIPVPTIDVYMGSDINNPSSGQAVWNASIELGDNSQYYIQYGYKASFPSYIDVGLASLRGDYSYNYYNYTSTNYIDIVSLESLTTATNQSKPASYFQTAWQTFYDDYLIQSLMPDFGTQVNAMSSAMLEDAKDYYVDYMLGQIPMYGNRLEIFARYFIIDSENDNRVVVGAWNHWSSKDGSRTKERPSNYIDNVALPGYINTNNDVDYQDNSSSFNSVGDSTGVPSTVINNNYVPNYPDYPTIASYNKDNLLVSTIGKMGEIKGFFGEFNEFLLATFIWVPDWIWSLIGLGFGLSIIVFFLRML